MKFNLSEKLNNLLSLNKFGKGQDNDEIYDLLKEFIKGRKARISNQLKIHWGWLKNRDNNYVSEFINNIIDEGAGPKLT